MATVEYPPRLGGVATLCYEQATGLAALGHEVRVETLDVGPAGPEAGRADVRRNRNNWPPVVRMLPLAWSLHRAVREFAPDVLYCPQYRGYSLPVRLLSRLWGKPYAVYIHGTELQLELRNGARKRAMFRFLGDAAAVMTNSRNSARLIGEWYAGAARRVVPVLPGVHSERFTREDVVARGAELRARWMADYRAAGQDGEPVILLTVCRLSPQKGADKTLTALRSMAQEHPDLRWLFIIAGDGPQRAELEALCREFGLSGRVKFLGRMEYTETPALYCAADVYVQPSQPVGGFIESFGISFLEAQSAGLPCVASRFGGVGEAVADGETALMVEAGDDRQLRDTLLALLKDDGRRERMSEAARVHARNYSWASHVQELALVLESCVSGEDDTPTPEAVSLAISS